MSSVLVIGTRGIKARSRHLMRDLQRLLPHSVLGSKLDTEEDGIAGVAGACEDADCATALLFDARDPRRLYMWVAACPDGPSAMFRVRNIHTATELNFDVRRCGGVRNLLVFDKAFDASVDRRLLKTLLTRALSVPRGAAKRVAVSGASGAAAAADEAEASSDGEHSDASDAEDGVEEGDDDEQADADELDDASQLEQPRRKKPAGVERVKHVLSFSWLDERIWVRVYRIGPDAVTGAMDVKEIGPRFVLEPVRIIASAFGGAVLHTHPSSKIEMLDEHENEWR